MPTKYNQIITNRLVFGHTQFIKLIFSKEFTRKIELELMEIEYRERSIVERYYDRV